MNDVRTCFALLVSSSSSLPDIGEKKCTRTVEHESRMMVNATCALKKVALGVNSLSLSHSLFLGSCLFGGSGLGGGEMAERVDGS